MSSVFKIENHVDVVDLGAVLLKSRSNMLEDCEVCRGEFVDRSDVDERFGLSVSTHTMETIELGLATQLRWMETVNSIANDCVEAGLNC